MAGPVLDMPPSATGMLGADAQTQIRLTRIDGRLDALETGQTDLKTLMGRVIGALEGRTKLTEKCIDLVTAFVSGPNVKWLALVVLGLAAIGNGVVMSGYGLTLGDALTGNKPAAEGTP